MATRKKTEATMLPPGTRVMDDRGNLGTVVGWAGRHNGFYVRYDERFNQFSPDVCRVSSIRLTPTDPKLHEQWEKRWATAAFIDRSWTAAACGAA
jgi:hypothetical protein